VHVAVCHDEVPVHPPISTDVPRNVVRLHGRQPGTDDVDVRLINDLGADGVVLEIESTVLVLKHDEAAAVVGNVGVVSVDRQSVRPSVRLDIVK
jgi:hypothetical protein